MKQVSELSKIVNLKTLKINLNNLSERQKQFAHLIDPRFFEKKINIFRTPNKNYKYETPLKLERDLFYLHPLMDPSVLEQGAVRRFPSGINERYICEKYFEDKWVSEGNNELANLLDKYVTSNLKKLNKQTTIKIIDIGPCGGAITTLFALRSLAKHNLLDKVEIALLDIVPNVLEATILGKFIVPNELLNEYNLRFAGKDGVKYKKLLSNGSLIGVKEWYDDLNNSKCSYTDDALKKSGPDSKTKVKYFRGDGENLPKEVINTFDIVLSAYTHHHMNFYGRKKLCEQMESAAKRGGFIGVADFYVPSYEKYMEWYKPHFEKYHDAPPVECPLVDGKELAAWFKKTKIKIINENIKRSVVFGGIKL